MLISMMLMGCAALGPVDPWSVNVPDGADYLVYSDADGDGFGWHGDRQLVSNGEPIPAGYSRESNDCDDLDPDVHPNEGCECGDGMWVDGVAYDTLQRAISSAEQRRNVYVCPGRHELSSTVKVERSLRLASWNGDESTATLVSVGLHRPLINLSIDGKLAEVEVANLSFTGSGTSIRFMMEGILDVFGSRFYDLEGEALSVHTSHGRVAIRDTVFTDNETEHSSAVWLSNDGDLLVQIERAEFVGNRGYVAAIGSTGSGAAGSLALELRDVVVDRNDSEVAAVSIGSYSIGTLTVENSQLTRNIGGAVRAGEGAFADVVSIDTDWGDGEDDNPGGDLNGIDDLGPNETFECRIGDAWEEKCRP